MSQETATSLLKAGQASGVTTLGLGALSAEICVAIAGIVMTAIFGLGHLWISYHFKNKHYKLELKQLDPPPTD